MKRSNNASNARPIRMSEEKQMVTEESTDRVECSYGGRIDAVREGSDVTGHVTGGTSKLIERDNLKLTGSNGNLQ